MTNQNNIIRYGQPFSRWFRRRNRPFTGISYNDRSPEVIAMNAHLRAAAYGDGEFKLSSAYDADRDRTAALEIASLPNLLRQYDNQARDNFAKEALLFALITVIGVVWPIAHTLHALLL